jgi:hypothetical protein
MIAKTSASIALGTAALKAKAPKNLPSASLKIPPNPAVFGFIKDPSVFTFIQGKVGGVQQTGINFGAVALRGDRPRKAKAEIGCREEQGMKEIEADSLRERMKKCLNL